jgi:hypothetical protein
MNIRMLPPVNVAFQTRVVNNRTYSGTPGSAIDVPDFDASQLEANGWIRIAPSGPTSARPAGTLPPYPATSETWFFDETISKLIVYDGATWRDPATGSAV